VKRILEALAKAFGLRSAAEPSKRVRPNVAIWPPRQRSREPHGVEPGQPLRPPEVPRVVSPSTRVDGGVVTPSARFWAELEIADPEVKALLDAYLGRRRQGAGHGR
jgi:hypothetical protein